MSDRSYWFADINPEQTGSEYRWQPCLQLPVSICHSFDVWFRSEAECLDYIREYIIGADIEEQT